MRFLERRYAGARAVVLLLLGSGAILAARARHESWQSKPVARAPAPELVGKSWINAKAPITMASRRGKVTMVEFWTFACSNCLANLPVYERLDRRFAGTGFQIIGIHTPELPQERNAKNVQAFVLQHGIRYPVLLDAQSENWNRWHQKYWPAIYLVDKKGMIRWRWIGELNDFGENGESALSTEIFKLLQEPA